MVDRGIAVVDTDGTITWAELEAAVARYTAVLAALGAGPGGRIGWVMANRVEVLYLALAARRLAAPVVSFSHRSPPAELARLIAVARPAVVVVDGARGPVPGGVCVLNVDDPLPDVSGPPAVLGTAAPDRLGAGPSLLFTSGTTSTPKAAQRSRGDRRLAASIGDAFGLGPDSRFLVAGPLYHSGPWTCALLTLARGGVVGLRPGFDPHDWMDFAVQHRMNSGFLTPTQLRRLVGVAGPGRVLPRLSDVVVSGEPFPQELKLRVLSSLGDGFVECYGCTELGPLTALRAAEFAARPGSSGRPFPGVEVAAYDRETRLGPGQVGVLRARTPMAFDGYVGGDGGGPDALPGGWISVGDLGSVDADGYVYLAGRADDLIISGGVNIHPADVEAVLGTHPEVLDCAVFGLPDAEWGEVVAAAVVCRQEIDVGQVRQWLRGRIADDKRPRRLFRVDALPTTPSGKVSRNLLRHAVAAEA